MNNNIYNSLSGIDALGRNIPEIKEFKQDKFVGVFYWLWHNGSNRDRDTTVLLKEHPDEFWDPYDKTGYAPPGAMYHFNEPLYGYYSSQDEWVLRKHIELFIYAGVDFLGLDYTNPGVYFEKALFTLLGLLSEYNEKGWNTPKVMFLTNTGSSQVVSWLYNNIYEKGLYKELWFFGPYDKPLITVGGDDLAAGIIPREYLKFFHVRPSQWPGFEFPFYENGFSWCDLNRPQKVHEDMINVCVAQHHSYIFSYGMRVDPKVTPRGINYGRGYTTMSNRNGDVSAILAGANIQEHWDYAISKNPDIVFVTGWNEWATNKRHAFFEGQTVATFVDSFNTEFSRDMEMTKNPTYIIDEETSEYVMEGYGDNYYMQLVQNIRKYKGVSGTSSSGDCEYLNVALVNKERNFNMYYQAKADNFIKKISVSNDNLFIKFRIETENSITKWDTSRTNWMNIFIGIDSPKYQFVINRHPKSDCLTSLEPLCSDVLLEYISYNVNDNIMSVFIPIKAIGIKNGSFKIYFKCSDSVQKELDVLDYYVSGSSVPLGRLSYMYTGETIRKDD